MTSPQPPIIRGETEELVSGYGTPSRGYWRAFVAELDSMTGAEYAALLALGLLAGFVGGAVGAAIAIAL